MGYRLLTSAVVLLAACHCAISEDGSVFHNKVESYTARWFGPGGASPRSLEADTYSITKYVQEDSSITIDDCNRDRTNVYSASFAALRSDDNSAYYGHLFIEEDMPCLGTVMDTEPDVNLKECLEFADAVMDLFPEANSFTHDNTDSMCTVYTGWREHKFRQCKRDRNAEKVVYLRSNRPAGFDECDGVELEMASLDPNTDGLLTLTVNVLNNYCCCEINRMTIEYLGSTYDFDLLDPYQYIYPIDDTGYLNVTDIRAYSGGQIAGLFEVIPNDVY